MIKENTKYKTVNGKRVGYFMFEEDQDDMTSDGETWLQFYTGWDGRHADDSHQSDVYEDLEELLVPHFPGILVGAAESCHIIDPLLPEEHKQTMEYLREVLTGAGWQEVD